MKLFGILLIGFLAAGCGGNKASADQQQQDVDPPVCRWPGEQNPGCRWNFDRFDVPGIETTLTDIWGNSNNDLFAVGWDGVILRKLLDEDWERMSSPTSEHLTSIIGVENGREFGMPDNFTGELYAVGWNGTLLHYHPNPDDDPDTDDGAWAEISGPGGQRLTPLLKVDPACPDFDGDGIGDDGDGSGWSGDAVCSAGNTSSCDDNCRKSANGSLRPIVDSNTNQCIDSADTADPDLTNIQRDEDGDSLGSKCDENDLVADPADRYAPVLFDIWADSQGGDVTLVVVGEGGTLITFQGSSAAATSTAPLVTDVDNWTVQSGVAFRFDDDCPVGTPVGTICAGAPRLPPSCPAQCNPVRTNCVCPPTQGQCCDGGASTGVGCSDGSCGPAVNACGATNPGECNDFCPDCFRRLDETLRSVSSDGTQIVAIGANGTVVIAPDLTNPTDVWRFPTCVAPPTPLDNRPLLTAVSSRGSNFHIVGSEGAVFRYPGGGCFVASRPGAPKGFMSGVFSAGGNRAWAVGDLGLLLYVDGSSSSQLDASTAESFNGIWVTGRNGDNERLWMVGASGTILRAGYFGDGAVP
jgi:hypothetical protein